jgi:hypothetical protein
MLMTSTLTASGCSIAAAPAAGRAAASIEQATIHSGRPARRARLKLQTFMSEYPEGP